MLRAELADDVHLDRHRREPQHLHDGHQVGRPALFVDGVLAREGAIVAGIHPVWSDDRGVYTCAVVAISDPPRCGAEPGSASFVFLEGIAGADLPQEMGPSEHGALRYGVVDLSGTVSAGGVVIVDRYAVHRAH